MALKLDKILELLKMSEETFVSMPEDAWSKMLTEHEQNNPHAFSSEEMTYLNNLQRIDTREEFFVNNLKETSAPAEISTEPGITFGQMLTVLNINRVKFLTMSETNWEKAVTDAMNDKRANNPQDSQHADYLEQLLLNFVNINARKRLFVNSEPGYQPLQKFVDPAKTASQNEQTPPSVITAQGLLYMAAGNKPAEMVQNKRAILEAYKMTMKQYYKDLSDDEKKKYGTEKDFFKKFAAKETSFKNFETLEKSEVFKELSEDDQALYRSQKDKFPMNIITLPFDKPEDGPTFMDKIKEHVKPMPSAVKKDEEADKTNTATPPATPNPS